MRKLYCIPRLLSGNFKTTGDLSIIRKNGTVLTPQKVISSRWVECLKEILNRPAPTEKFTFDNITSIEDPNVELGTITKTEIVKAIKTIKKKTKSQD